MLSNYRLSSLQGKVVLGATEDATHGALARPSAMGAIA